MMEGEKASSLYLPAMMAGMICYIYIYIYTNSKAFFLCARRLFSYCYSEKCFNFYHLMHVCCYYSVCDGTFFPSLLNEMSDIVGCFNQRAQKLLELHLASGVRKYFFWIKGKLQGNHTALIQEGKDLVTYALINAIAIRKILKKYDKVWLFSMLLR